MELQNFSVNDGDGIRTIIFFAGCPIRCAWCANPESSLGYKPDNAYIFRYSVEEILKEIEKQRIFYRYSGGGVTFSGGEPTLQLDILRGLTGELYDRGISLAIETSRVFVFEQVAYVLENR